MFVSGASLSELSSRFLVFVLEARDDASTTLARSTRPATVTAIERIADVCGETAPRLRALRRARASMRGLILP
jgi:hypothetical protein